MTFQLRHLDFDRRWKNSTQRTVSSNTRGTSSNTHQGCQVSRQLKVKKNLTRNRLCCLPCKEEQQDGATPGTPQQVSKKDHQQSRSKSTPQEIVGVLRKCNQQAIDKG
jgi:hypothetical protein